ncbi:hypothetical protein RUM4293_02342 [Ruegeria atlantica]|uniref:HNH endonuclease 5 domain-containing protein n=1 Tax=Ruegeria atlantica TaxID=81569 RepID=A0A0P1EMW9_9RHOB|nr:hypothetical protein RUM4293_02342 [Ruegeria atlantica]
MIQARIPSAGYCIYCGAKVYSDDRKKLGDEHIIPFSLEGELVFLEASCLSCERVTGRFESKLLRNTLLATRVNLNLRSRNSALSQTKALPLFVDTVAGVQKVLVNTEDYPTVLHLPYLPDPPIVSEIGNLGPTEYPPRPFTKFLNYNKEILNKKYGLSNWNHVSLDNRLLCRLVAKIAHGWCIANKKVTEYTPILDNMIIDPNLESRELLSFVGGTPPEPKTPKELHQIRAKIFPVEGIDFIVVNVRLFAFLGTPTYSVVSGIMGDIPKNGLPNCSARTKGLPNFSRISIPAY